jgi:hypothetical protein
MQTAARRTVLAASTALVWVAALGLLARHQKLAAKAPFTVEIGTAPERVRLTVDGEAYAKGAYLETPTRLTLAAGKHKLKIGRDGYVAHVMTVEADAGETLRMTDVVLAKSPDAVFGAAEILVDGEVPAPPVRLVVDDGFAVGSAAQPLKIEELTVGTAHELTVLDEGDGSAPPLLRCRFTPALEPAVAGETTVIRLSIKANKWKAAGCERLRPPKPAPTAAP